MTQLLSVGEQERLVPGYSFQVVRAQRGADLYTINSINLHSGSLGLLRGVNRQKLKTKYTKQ